MRIAQDEDGDAVDIPQFVGTQGLRVESASAAGGPPRTGDIPGTDAGVVELPAKVGVTVLQEANFTGLQPGIGLDVGFGNGLVRGLIADLQLPKGLCDIEFEGVGMEGPDLALSRSQDFNEDVGLGKLVGQG